MFFVPSITPGSTRQPRSWLPSQDSYFQLSSIEWCCLVIAASSVWTAEALNTALELLADAAIEELHPLVGYAKDVAAGAVLVTAIAAVIVGAIIFWPHIATLFFPAETTAV